MMILPTMPIMVLEMWMMRVILFITISLSFSTVSDSSYIRRMSSFPAIADLITAQGRLGEYKITVMMIISSISRLCYESI